MKKFILLFLSAIFCIFAEGNVYAVASKTVFIGRGLPRDINLQKKVDYPTDGLQFMYRSGNWTLSDATHVSIWNDSSGNGRNASQSVGVSQPTLSGDGGLTFNGAFIKVPDSGVYPAQTTNQFTLVVRMKYNGPNTWNMLWARSDSSGNKYGMFYHVSSPPENQIYYRFGYGISGDVYTDTGPACVPTPGVKAIFICSVTRAGYFKTWNQTTSASFNQPGFLSSSGESWNIGSLAGGVFPLNAIIYDVWGYSRILTDSEISAFRSLP